MKDCGGRCPFNAERPHTGEGGEVLRAASGAGCWQRDPYSGRITGLSAVELRQRLAGGGDPHLLATCLASIEAGVLGGLAASGGDET
ncbi:MAG: hypothetical protein CMN87_14655 [Stappia sp.]|uniref:hypothetical protein n=1 Tax=Stappia sp. TaxID=1870903 RepID=UPI000C360F5D|nr:hypothetical protein [Stappia sp.]MAA99968.1 hypothetical protein [Stappia sp.]MBM21247.1 hypothetical protein [Stappia sp.]